jgi:hypothetical protein
MIYYTIPLSIDLPGTVTVDLITMEPEHLRLKTFHSRIPHEYGHVDSAAPPASLTDSLLPVTPAFNSMPMHFGAKNSRYSEV